MDSSRLHRRSLSRVCTDRFLVGAMGVDGMDADMAGIMLLVSLIMVMVVAWLLSWLIGWRVG